MRRIFICFFSLIVFNLCFSSFLFAQDNKNSKGQKEDDTEKTVIYRGTYASLDLLNPAMSLLGTKYLQGEVAVDVNLKNMFFPVAEIGYGNVSYKNDQGLTYKSRAPYFRVGLNYNVMAKKGTESHFYIGLRYGLSSFNYDITSQGLTDPVWPGEIDFNRSGKNAFAQWIELVAGVRVQIVRNFMMGWSVRLRREVSKSVFDDHEPWYIPGYGYSGTTSIGATYSLIYKFNIKSQNK